MSMGCFLMPRLARERSSTGIYHVMLRGINRQVIFIDVEDRVRFLETVARYKKETGFELFAYCLIDNHIHLLIKENQTELPAVMRKIATSYANYFNCKHGRSGHLFQDRYKSEAVEDESYFYTVIRYIHQNPVKAGISGIEAYKWSSYNDYINEGFIIDKGYFLDMLDVDRKSAVKKYISYMNEPNEDKCLDTQANKKLTDDEVCHVIKLIGKLGSISDIHRLGSDRINEILRRAKEVEGLSVLQISRVTGINRSKIVKA